MWVCMAIYEKQKILAMFSLLCFTQQDNQLLQGQIRL